MQRRGIAILAPAAVLVAVLILTGEPAHTPVVINSRAEATVTPDLERIHGTPARLESKLDALMVSCPGTPHIVIEDAGGSWRISRSGDAHVRAASVIKLPILLAVLRLRDRSAIDLDCTTTVLPEDRTEGSGAMKYQKLPLSCPLSELLAKMITESDNTATNAVIRIVGMETIAAEFPELGLSTTSLKRRMLEDREDNPTTASEIADLLVELSRRTAVPVGASGAIVSDVGAMEARWLLRRTSNVMRLKRNLPDTAIIDHKTGTLRDLVHDAGIIATASGEVIVAGLVSGVRNRDAAEEWLGRLGKLVYEEDGAE